jgi:hypothetical protein
MRAIKTNEFADRDLVECLELLAVHDPSEFAKFLSIATPKQSYLAARPHAEVVEPRAAVNLGEDRGPPTPNAIPPRARKAIAAAARRAPYGTNRNRNHWQWWLEKNPLINEARRRQGQFTLTGAPRVRSRSFNMKTFGQDLGAVAMRAIRTNEFVDRDLVECLELLAVRDPSEFAKFLSIAAPKQSYLAARPHAEEPREAVNPGAYRRPPIPEWTLDYDLTLRSMTPVPLDQALSPPDAYHEVYGAPFYPAPDWDWKFDSEERRFRAIALRPKTPIPEWTQRCDPLGAMTPVLVDPRLTPDQAYHGEYGSPLYPAPGWKWEWNSRTQRLLPSISGEPKICDAPAAVSLASRPGLLQPCARRRR